ncbi:DUF4044 domain-containing protein [Lacticaseibacillus pabuli]|uniref:DUF4044 domain-containing protein n=1 Tax=Lacticaseibacillus pabuli TaxID=3025672 RepID=A0ABY7WPG3_9LACO|nr:DUF4044 domain-containing protein [Lacticaseibacillus sp. KACC 23028]WDF81679.1 DUF4044 domain-containing protein [Lacticaseibacillus sp. KACC 23028]
MKEKKSTMAKVVQVVVWLMLIVTVLAAVLGAVASFA